MTRSRRLLIVALAILAVLAVAHTALWMIATARLQDELAGWQMRRRAAGWTAAAGQPVRAGWPFAAAVRLADPVLAGGDKDVPGGLSWHAGEAELAIALLRPDVLRVRLSGQQRLRLSTLPEFGFAADRFELTIPLNASSADRGPLDLAATGLQVALSTGALDIAAIALHADTWPAAPPGQAALAVTCTAETINLPPLRHARPWPIGSHIAAASFEAALTGPWPGAGDVALRAASWRDAGGKLEVRRLALAWGALGLSASATAALDEQMQPMGAATARVQGYDAALHALVSSGVLGTRVAQAIGGVLGLLARPAEQGGAPQVEVPITLDNRTLSLGPFPLVRLREWVWP
jgi:hypothetical protein